MTSRRTKDGAGGCQGARREARGPPGPISTRSIRILAGTALRNMHRSDAGDPG
jgi:hypothetical protein